MKTAKRYPFPALLRQRLQLHFEDQARLTGSPGEAQFRRWAWQAVKSHYRRAEISLLLLDEVAARAYNRDYRQKDYATNVLSFALDEGEQAALAGFSGSLPPALHGDLIICPQVVAREAAEQGKTLEAHFAHLTLHGVLHLMGYDHISPAEAEEMESLEIRLMNQLGYPNPYAQDAD
ncbi:MULTISPECIES: rRNA maturation RNase YbeY [Eikenella]|uniref:Endoribonuclease YbeY n=1 Tax=Eikenella longinqua TaxID=1795827 RepID=A0A1A9S3K0_9NEIS|nr:MULTISPECIES: rRNA maturation RNase YbeY [Eikenella]OAM31536.1 rRNA maturation RNase YbeY [Eikenella longinqua]